MRVLGLEPKTYGLKGRCSTKLSYTPLSFAIQLSILIFCRKLDIYSTFRPPCQQQYRFLGNSATICFGTDIYLDW